MNFFSEFWQLFYCLKIFGSRFCVNMQYAWKFCLKPFLFHIVEAATCTWCHAVIFPHFAYINMVLGDNITQTIISSLLPWTMGSFNDDLGYKNLNTFRTILCFLYYDFFAFCLINLHQVLYGTNDGSKSSERARKIFKDFHEEIFHLAFFGRQLS